MMETHFPGSTLIYSGEVIRGKEENYYRSYGSISTNSLILNTIFTRSGQLTLLYLLNPLEEMVFFQLFYRRVEKYYMIFLQIFLKPVWYLAMYQKYDPQLGLSSSLKQDQNISILISLSIK